MQNLMTTVKQHISRIKIKYWQETGWQNTTRYAVEKLHYCETIYTLSQKTVTVFINIATAMTKTAIKILQGSVKHEG